jgi:alkaline phosphatase
LVSSSRTWLVVVLLLLPTLAQATPTNVIIVIGDGMGPAHEEAARLYNGGALAWDSAPHQAEVTTHSLHGVTDSAAAASAMATGVKYNNLSVSRDAIAMVDYPTSLEHHAALGKSTGLVTTSYIEDGTPAAFGAHADHRLLYPEIVSDYLTGSRPNVLLGSTQPGFVFGPGIDPAQAAAAGYTVALDRAQLQAIDITTTDFISGQFGANEMPSEYEYSLGGNTFYDTQPFLSEMASFALDMLDQDPDGFFLLIEQEGIDLAGHADHTGPSRIGADVFATLELSDTLQLVLDWIAARPDPSDTLLIVTADHETGGLEILADNGAGNLPTVSYSTTDHTSTNVNAYAWGPNSKLVTGLIDNTDIFAISTVPEPSLGLLLACAAVLAAFLRR